MHLIRSQDPEGGDDLLRGVRVSGLTGHEVHKGLKRDPSGTVGIHQRHDPRKLGFTLRTRLHGETSENIHAFSSN